MSINVGMHRDTTGQSNYHAHTRAMWFEYKIGLDSSSYLPETARATYWPPSSFIQSELGFGIDTQSDTACGPGCKCTSLSGRPSASSSKKGERRRKSGRDWQAVVSSIIPNN